MLYKSVIDHAEVDKLMSNYEIAQKRHFCDIFILCQKWFLFLFSVLWFPPRKEKESQKKLLLFKPFAPVVCPSPRFGAGFGKPDFPSNVDKSASLSELITKDLCLFFHVMQMDSCFLLENPANTKVSKKHCCCKSSK